VDSKLTPVPGPPGLQTNATPTALGSAWLSIRARILGGLLLVLPVLIAFWVVYWLYSALEQYLIDPLARLVLWKVRLGQPDADLPPWFENYAAPLVGVVIALLLLYGLGFCVKSGLHRVLDAVMLRVPGVSIVYNGVRQVFQTLDRQGDRARPQRVVLVPFPHSGMKTACFVTSSCRDVETGKVILCVYVPTSPVPTSGFFLMVPEEDAIESGWNSEKTVQAILSGGLTAPSEVRYFKPGPAAGPHTTVAPVTNDVPLRQCEDGGSPSPGTGDGR
jgi:uncharacterized membrane protein